MSGIRKQCTRCHIVKEEEKHFPYQKQRHSYATVCKACRANYLRGIKEEMEIKRIRRPWQPDPQHPSYGHKNNHDKRYHSQRWRNDRRYFLTEHPLCSGPDSLCEKQGKITMAVVCDHIHPVSKGGNFWDWDNRQGLCKHCNAVKTAKDKLKPQRKP